MTSPDNLTDEYLTAEHKKILQGFQCSDEEQVETFLKTEALPLLEKNFVRTRLFFDENQNLVGFYSLFNDSIKMSSSKRKELAIRLPENVKDIPAVRLHYLGVDSRYRGNGYGIYLMGEVLYNCAAMARMSGCTLLTLESTENAKGFYEKFGFVYICPQHGYHFMAYNTQSLQELL